MTGLSIGRGRTVVVGSERGHQGDLLPYSAIRRVGGQSQSGCLLHRGEGQSRRGAGPIVSIAAVGGGDGLRTASKEGDVGNGSRLCLARQQHVEAAGGDRGDIHAIIAIDVSHVGEDVAAVDWIVGRRAKRTVPCAQQDAYRGIALIGRDDVEFAVAIEISNRQVVGRGGRRAVVLHVGHWSLKAGGRRSLC